MKSSIWVKIGVFIADPTSNGTLEGEKWSSGDEKHHFENNVMLTGAKKATVSVLYWYLVDF